MSPIDQLLANDWTLPAVAVCFIALVFWVRRQVRAYNVSTAPARPDRHLPADEYRLLGEDWRDQVADYMGESFIRHTRNRFAVMAVTGADPDKKTAPARVELPDAMTTHGGTSNEQYR